MILYSLISLIILYIWWKLHFDPVRDNKFTRRTIIRCKLMQEDLKHGRTIRKYNNLV